jgi:uncharacterized protein (TIGR02145 family)
MLDVKSTNKGVLMPRMTYKQRNSIVNPEQGLMVICSNCNPNGLPIVSVYLSGKWQNLAVVCDVPISPVEGFHIPGVSQITWKWNVVPISQGYRWNMIDDYATSVDLGDTTSMTEFGLVSGLMYNRYLWSYNECGHSDPTPLTQSTSVGSTGNFVCNEAFTDQRDGKIYNTILIGIQCWFAQNLNIGVMISNSSFQTNNSIIEKHCYNDNENNCGIYGGLYQWDELLNYTTSSNTNPSGRQGICPSGWHIPSDLEFCQLEVFLDSQLNCGDLGWVTSTAGGQLKQAGTSLWTQPNTGATNSSGFTAIPSGSSYKGGGFNSLHEFSAFWTATQNGSISAKYRGLMYDRTDILRNDVNKSTYGFSGRCIKDSTCNYTNAGISISTPSSIVCSGTSVTFTASPSNGGSSPIYQWTVNGANVGSNSSTYSYLPVNGDNVICAMTSSLPCVSSPAISNTITMSVNSPVATPVSGSHTSTAVQIIWNWNSVPNSIGYKWNVTNNYATAIDMGTSTSKTENGLNCNTTYSRYVWAYNICGNSSALTLTQATLSGEPNSPVPGTQIPSTNQVTWNWNSAAGALGYKWNTTNNYATALDIGTGTSKTETGLSCGINYIRFVWSYNNCGHSSAVNFSVLTQTDTTS